MVILKFEGQQIEISEAMAADEKTLLEFVASFNPALANSTISRTREGGRQVITLTKRAGTKAAPLPVAIKSGVSLNLENLPGSSVEASPFAVLLNALADSPETLNPAVGLAWRLRWQEARGELTLDAILALQPNLEEAIRSGEDENQRVAEILTALTSAAPVEGKNLLAGF